MGTAVFLALAAFIAYLPVLNASLTNWDDPVWVTQNLYIRHFNPVSLKWIFGGLLLGTWTPMTWLSYSLDYRLGGLDPFVYHLHNLILHCVATVLVYLVFLKLGSLAASPDRTGKTDTGVHPIRASAWMAALFFGIHPIHVENVAWVSDRIDLLCAVFFLASVLFYLHHAAGGKQSRIHFFAALGFFCLSLASKPTAVTLPLVLILLDVGLLHKPWKGLWDALKGKIAFLLPALFVSLLTIIARSGAGNLSSLAEVPATYRIMNAFHSLVFYLVKIVAPVELCPLYPMFRDRTFSAPYVLSFLAVVLLSVGCFWARKKAPGLVLAWLLYVVMLFPTLGLISSGSQAAADRYAYLPSLVPFLLLALVLHRLFPTKRLYLAVVVLAVALALGWGARKQTAFWKNSIALWEHELQYFPANYESSYAGLGDAYREMGYLENALKLYEMGIQGSPDVSYLYNGKAGILLEMGRLKEAIQACQEALARSVPGDEQFGWAHGFLDILFTRVGSGERAAAARALALSSAPKNAWQHFDLGTRYEKAGMTEPATAQFQEAVRQYPWYAEAYARMGRIYTVRSDNARALECYEKAVDLEPRNKAYAENLRFARQNL